MAPESPPAFIAMGHLYCDSVAVFQTAFAPHAQAIMADIANYTDIEPTIQISEVKDVSPWTRSFHNRLL